MTVSVSTIAERALRRLNVTVVPLDDRPTLTEFVPVATIATMALVELGVIASDETPLASDQALALDKVASVHAALDAQGLVWWDGTAVPRAFTEDSEADGGSGRLQLRSEDRPRCRGDARRPYPAEA